jgi:hypothetical protein
MDRLRDFLNAVRDQGVAEGRFLGLLHVLIGRRIALADGTEVSAGLTWREAAVLLKKVRWAKESVTELAVTSANLPPRDRQRYWYMAIAQAGVNSPAAIEAGDKLSKALRKLGYTVGPPPGAT